MNLPSVVRLLKRRRDRRHRRIVTSAMQELYVLTVTIHGRSFLNKVCQDYDNDLDPTLRYMYWILLVNAPIEEWASRN